MVDLIVPTSQGSWDTSTISKKVSISPTWKGIRLMVNGNYYTDSELIDWFRLRFLEAVNNTKAETEIWIETFVPKRTGQLRDSLIDWIRNNWELKDMTIDLDAQTDVPYARSIEGDPRHNATWYEHSGRLARAFYYGFAGKVFLDDPQATVDWFYNMGVFVRRQIDDDIQIAINSEVWH